MNQKKRARSENYERNGVVEENYERRRVMEERKKYLTDEEEEGCRKEAEGRGKLLTVLLKARVNQCSVVVVVDVVREGDVGGVKCGPALPSLTQRICNVISCPSSLFHLLLSLSLSIFLMTTFSHV